MSYQAILFDLDGTLLPMDQEVFTKGYFKALASVLCPMGLEADALTAAVWAGTKAMVQIPSCDRPLLYQRIPSCQGLYR